MIHAVELPAPGESVRCTMLSTSSSDDVWVIAEGDVVRIEFSRRDPNTGRSNTYRIRQYGRRDPYLRTELLRLRAAD